MDRTFKFTVIRKKICDERSREDLDTSKILGSVSELPAATLEAAAKRHVMSKSDDSLDCLGSVTVTRGIND